MANIIFYNKRKKVKIVPSKLKLLDHGGQARIYEFKYDGKTYILKAIPDQPEIFRRLRDIRYRLIKYFGRGQVPYEIYHRGLPVGQGVGTPKEFEFHRAQSVSLLVFRKIFGRDLAKYLENEEPLSKKRKIVAKKLLKILVSLQDAGIIHGDLYPDNFMLSTNKATNEPNIYMLDLEGAGLLNYKRTGWNWKPIVLGKDYLFPTAPEVNASEGPSFFSDRWLGVYLIFYTLTGFHPLIFLSRIDRKPLEAMCQEADKRTLSWPPKLSNTFPYVNKMYPPEKLREFMDYYFAKSPFERVLFMTYVIGFKEPQKRPSFLEVKMSLEEVLNT